MKLIIIASGPSLSQEQIEILNNNKESIHVLCINDNFKLVPWAQYMYACDTRWWEVNGKEVKETFKGLKYGASNNCVNYDGIKIKGQSKKGLALDKTINYGFNSGHQALNLAFNLGYAEIGLIGYDMKKSDDGKKHWFGDHPGRLNVESKYDLFIDAINVIARDLKNQNIKVYNCTLDSALTCFENKKLIDFIKNE